MPGLLLSITLLLILVFLVWVGRRFITPREAYNPFDQIYADNNGTTEPLSEVIDAITKYSKLGNAEASYGSDARAVINTTKDTIKQHCGIPAISNDKVIFTSGASEGNCMVIRGVVDAYHVRNVRSDVDEIGTTNLPHIITTSIEHKSVLDCVNRLSQDGRADITLVSPNVYGIVDVVDILRNITPNTILISVMGANNELGSLNPMKELCEYFISRRTRGSPKIFFHADMVQLFGRIRSAEMARLWIGMDAVTVSFHKLHGPVGIGCVVLSGPLADYMKIGDDNISQIAGAQNEGFRGGTEPVANIAGANIAMKHTFKNIDGGELERQNKMRNYLIDLLENRFNVLSSSNFAGQHDDYGFGDAELTRSTHPSKESIVILTPTYGGIWDADSSIPNTLTLSVIRPGPRANHICNIKMRERLRVDHDIIIGTGSACNTNSSKRNHVMAALKMPYIVRCGMIRISLGEKNTLRDCDAIVDALTKVIQLC